MGKKAVNKNKNHVYEEAQMPFTRQRFKSAVLNMFKLLEKTMSRLTKAKPATDSRRNKKNKK